MNIVADESVDKQIVEGLRESGNSVLYIAEYSPGILDEDVLQIANNENCLLLTADKDFGELIFREKYFIRGIVLIRLAGIEANKKREIVADVIKNHQEELSNSFTVVTPKLIRIRKYLNT